MPLCADDMSLKKETCLAIALKVFNARTKECLRGFTTRNCGRGDKKVSEVLRTKLKAISGDDSITDIEKEKLQRELLRETKLLKAEEEKAATKKRKLSIGPHRNDADNKKDELKQSVLKKLNFGKSIASTEDAAVTTTLMNSNSDTSSRSSSSNASGMSADDD